MIRVQGAGHVWVTTKWHDLPDDRLLEEVDAL
jgi:hypothetical protein